MHARMNDGLAVSIFPVAFETMSVPASAVEPGGSWTVTRASNPGSTVSTPAECLPERGVCGNPAWRVSRLMRSAVEAVLPGGPGFSKSVSPPIAKSGPRHCRAPGWPVLGLRAQHAPRMVSAAITPSRWMPAPAEPSQRGEAASPTA